MFEKYIVNGIEHTRAELEYAAKAQNVNFETLLAKLNAQVFRRELTMNDIELNQKFIVPGEEEAEPRIKTWGGLVEMEQVKESPISNFGQGVADKITRFAEGTVSIANNLIKGYETGEYGFIGEVITEGVFVSTLGAITANLRKEGYDIPERFGIIDLTTPKERRAMYEAHLVESAKKGLTLQEAQKLDPTNRIKLEGVLEWFDKYQYDVELDENGNPIDFIDLYSKGDIAGGSDALVQDVFSAAPSVIISRIPYGIGPAILGSSAYMENFERELYERLGEEVKESANLSYKNIGDKISRGDVVTNSLIHGASDFVMEFFGGRILNKIGKDIPMEQAKDILVNSTGTFFKTIAKGFGFEAATEGATGVMQEAADALTYGDIKTFSNLGRTFIKDGIIGGVLGGKSATISAKDILNTRKRQEWFGTKEWKQENLRLENELIETQKSYAKATTDGEKSNFKNKIKEILAKKKKHREDLYDFFDNLDNETLLAYANNYDKAEQALDIIGNNKYTKEEQDKAFKELQVINKKAEQFFDNTKIEYNSARQTGLSIGLKALEAIRKQKGAIGSSNRNSRITYINKAKADQLIAENKDLKDIFYDEKGNYSVQGVFLNKAKDGKFDIYIDEQNSANVESTNVIGHENLHGIISFNFKKGIGRENLIKATGALVKYLRDNGYGQVVDDINKRLAVKYNAITANGQILVDENGMVFFNKENEKNYEEYFTVLSDIVDSEKLKAGDKDVSKLVSSWNALMYGLGFKSIDFQNAESVLNFIKTYNKNIKDDTLFGKLKAKLISRVKARGLEAKDKKDIVSKPKVKKSIQYTPKQRDAEMNELGEKYTRQEWIDGKGEEVYWDMWSKGYIEDMVREQMSQDLRNLPGFSEADFISQTAIELKKAFENFDINKKETTQGKFGLAGWIGQNVKWKLNKVLRDGLATKEKFEDSLSDEAVASQVQEVISEQQDQTSFDEIDLLQEEISEVFKKEEELRGKAKGSKLRTTLKNEDNEGLPEPLVQKIRDIIVDIVANEELTPGNTAQNRAFIKSIENKVYEKLRRDIQNFIQVGNYRQNIYDNAILILQELKTKELVAIEKKIPADERIFTRYIGRLTKKADIQRAIDLDLLPPEAIDFADAGVDLRVKIDVESSDFNIENFQEAVARFYNPPTFVRSKKDPNKTVRSGLRGTRRDALAGYLAKNMAEDAIPEALKDSRVIKGRTDITKKVFDEAQALEITRAINKSIDHKFSKSAGRDIDNAIDGGDLSPFVHIKFSKKLRREFNSRLRAKRPGEVDEYYDDQIDQVFKYTDSLDESVYNRNKMQKLAFHYLINGSVILPEDGYKVTEAAELAQKNKVDPFSYKNPEDLINQFKKLTADKTLLDPETLPTFSNRQEFANGRVVIYDVADTKEAQIDLRKLADSHFGENFNNWCLCARLDDNTGVKSLDIAFGHWQDYTGDLGFKAVFIDGKLKYFREGVDGMFFDINDSAHNDIEYKDTKVDKDGFRKVYSFNYNEFQEDQDQSENLIKPDSYIYTAFYEKGGKDKKSGEYIKQEGLSRKVIERQFKNKEGELDGLYVDKGPEEIEGIYMVEQNIIYKKGKKVKSTEIDDVQPGYTTDELNIHREVLPSRLGGGLVEIRVTKTTVVKNYDKNGVLINVQKVLEGNLKPVALRNILSGAISDMVPGNKRYKFDSPIQRESAIRQNVDYNKKFVKGGKKVKITFNYDIDQVNYDSPTWEMISTIFEEGTVEFETAKVFGKPLYGKLENGEYQRIDGATNEFILKNAKYEIEGENTVSVKINAADQTLKNAEETVGPRIENAKFSRGISERLNEMLDRKKGIPADKIYSRQEAQRVAKQKKKFLPTLFLPPSAEDFMGLIYPFLGKGKQGDQDLKFIKDALIRPFSRANTELDAARQIIINDWANLQKRWKEVTKKLSKVMPGSVYTFDTAIRVYLWDKMGEAVPGLSVQEQKNLVDRVKADRMLLGFAENLQAILKLENGYILPRETWAGGSIASDVYRVSEEIKREEFLKPWQENIDEIFNEENLNKLEAIYGSDYRSALEDMIYSMKTGRPRNQGNDRINNTFYRWLNGSIGAIMFLNIKSALLQQISMVNYINYRDNNPFQAAKAFANQKQYWQDWAFIFNSDFLKQRRRGLQTGVEAAELASATINATNKVEAVIAYLLKKGFAPTQISDAIAISNGGALFYRNRINTYLNEGLSQKEAEQKAFEDFREVTEESQQSARPDRLSQQQRSMAGKVILSFQNYPMQQNRIMKRTFQDLINGRGDMKQHISRLAFYGFMQNLIFLGLQQAWFALLDATAFDDDDEQETKKRLIDTKTERTINGFVDTVLRGSGIYGAIISTIKNTAFKAYDELTKEQGRPNEAKIILEAIPSPMVQSKLRKINRSFLDLKYNKDAIGVYPNFDTRNPVITSTAAVIEGVTNAPTDRTIRKINNLRESFDSSNTVLQRVATFIGFSPYEFGIDPLIELKEATKEGRGQGRKTSSKKCKGITSSGGSCKNNAQKDSDYCWAHQ